MSLLSACEWTPSSGPVRPERLASGEFVVAGMLDNLASRFVWIVRRGEERNRHFIFDLKSRTSCEVPERTRPLDNGQRPLQPPTRVKDVVFLWPLLKTGSDLEESVVFVDERCKPVEFFTNAGSATWTLPLDDGQGSALLVSNRQGRLSLVDPWRERENLIATGVGGFALRYSSTTDPDPGPQALWMIERGELKLRELDGTLRVSIGKDVTGFVQGAFSQLRIAFIAGGSLYEAVAPNFQPVLLSVDACGPGYSGTTLSFASPCAENQLVRIDLTSGIREEFEPGVYEQWEVRGMTFERKRDDEGKTLLYVTPPLGERTQVEPALGSIQVLDADTIAGVDAAGRLGLWRFQGGFTSIFENVRNVRPFVDQRTDALLWLVHHDVEDEIGTVSLLEQSKLKVSVLATGVPMGGYEIITGLQQVPEPVLMALRDATPLAFDEMDRPIRFRGTLEVKLISGSLPSEIDSDVSSFQVVYDTEAGGLLYTIDTGERQGLWFAAL